MYIETKVGILGVFFKEITEFLQDMLSENNKLICL